MIKSSRPSSYGTASLAALVLCLSLAACGGGGGNSNSGLDVVTPPATPAATGQLQLVTANAGGWLTGVVADVAGNLFVANNDGENILKISADGTVSLYAGNSHGYPTGEGDGTGGNESLDHPSGVAMDAAGNMYVTDSLANTIRKITPTDTVTTVAGTAFVSGSADGTGPAAQFNYPFAIVMGTDGNCYISDARNSTIRKMTPDGAVTTIAGMAGVAGSADGVGAAARFRGPEGIAADGLGNLYVADTGNNTVRKITPDGTVSTLAGNASVVGERDGAGPAALFVGPQGIASDAAGNVYVADPTFYTVRRITPGGVVQTVVGVAGQTKLGPQGQAGNQTGPLPGLLDTPVSLAVIGTNTLIVATYSGVLKVTFN